MGVIKFIISTVAFALLLPLVSSGTLQPYDETLLESINNWSGNPPLDAFIRVITEAGSPIFWLGLSVLHLLLAKKRRFSLLLSIAIAMLVSQLFVDMTRLAYGRPRPYTNPDLNVRLLIEAPQTPSFPSGHATRAFSGGFTIAFFYGRRSFSIIPLSALVGLSRIYLGVHYPNDIIGGALLGFAVAEIVRALVPAILALISGKKDRY